MRPLNLAGHWLEKNLPADRPSVMGILNVTPDSFSDGGQFVGAESAIAHAHRMEQEGADLIDVGGESTRPYGSVPIDAATEWDRIAPVLEGLRDLKIPMSVDTMKAEVAAKAVAAGARLINDVWGLQRDAAIAEVAAAHDVGLIVMHNRESADPTLDIMHDIRAFFTRSLEIAERAGVPRERIILDPGIGFGKTPPQSMLAIARVGELGSFGLPLLMGLSRKRFIAGVAPAEPDRRLGGSLAGNLIAAREGAAILRVHDVQETVQALAVAAAIENAK